MPEIPGIPGTDTGGNNFNYIKNFREYNYPGKRIKDCRQQRVGVKNYRVIQGSCLTCFITDSGQNTFLEFA